jgi:hypothetical protein
MHIVNDIEGCRPFIKSSSQVQREAQLLLLLVDQFFQILR